MRPRHYSLLTAFKKDTFTLIKQEDLDYYLVGHEYSIDPPAFRKSNKGVLVLLKHTETE